MGAYFEPVASAAAEQEDTPDEGVQPELLLHNGGQAVNGLTHIGHACDQVDCMGFQETGKHLLHLPQDADRPPEQ